MIPPILANARVQRRIARLLDQADEALEAADWQGPSALAPASSDVAPDTAVAAPSPAAVLYWFPGQCSRLALAPSKLPSEFGY